LHQVGTSSLLTYMMHGHTYIKLVYCCFSLVHFRLRLFIVYMIYLFYIWICSGQCFIFLC